MAKVKQKEEKISGKELELTGREVTLNNGNKVAVFLYDNSFIIRFTNAERNTETNVKISSQAANALVELLLKHNTHLLLEGS